MQESEQESHITENVKVTPKIQTAKTTEQPEIKPKVVISDTEKSVQISSETLKSDHTKKEKRVEVNFKGEDNSLQRSTKETKQEENKFSVLETRSAKTTVEQAKASTQKEHIEKLVPATQTEVIEKSTNNTEVVKNGERDGKAQTLLTGVKQVENFHVAIEVNVDVDDMSRKYSGLSSSRG